MPNYDYRCRKATPQDSIEKIARYIHLTDPYIYPSIWPDPNGNAWKTLVSECVAKTDNIFSIYHISVVTYCNDIVGIACVIPCGQKLTFVEGIAVPDALRESILPAIDGYFGPLAAESVCYSGHNIVNVCIDENHRGKGVGKRLMEHCVCHYGSDTMHLDVIASNSTAIKLYKEFGFEISNQYMGFSGDDTPLPCYHMVRIPE